MNEETLNATNEEVVQPQNNGAENEELANPQNVEEMSDEEFSEYLKSAQNGTLDREVQADRSDGKEDGADEESRGGDTGDAEPAEDEQKEEEKPFKVFKTQKEYQGEFDRIMGERLKKNREGMETLDGLKRLALNFYGTDDADAAIAQLTEDLQAQNAEKRGVSVEDYKQQTQDSADAQKYREEQSRARDREQRIAEIQSRWRKESGDLKTIVPDFDFDKAMKDKTFYDNIVKGTSVAAAYIAANKAAEKPPERKPQRKGIPQNGNMKGSVAGRAEANPASMSDTDFKRYIERIKG